MGGGPSAHADASKVIADEGVDDIGGDYNNKLWWQNDNIFLLSLITIIGLLLILTYINYRRTCKKKNKRIESPIIFQAENEALNDAV